MGWRLRLGVLQPSINVVAEPQLEAMAPQGVSIHTTRLKLASVEDLAHMADNVEEAATLLADAGVHRILFNCTAVTVHDADVGDRIRRRIGSATGIPATITADALVAAFQALEARRIVMVTPYERDINERETAFLNHHGIEVLREHGLNLKTAWDYLKVEPAEWYDLVSRHRDDRADAYFISCAQARAVEVIEAIEFDFGRPVVTSNQAAMWRCLRESGVKDRVSGFGTLFDR